MIYHLEIKYQFVLFVNSDLPPSQGGKYVGFGSAPNPPLNKEDSWASWSDSLSTVSIKLLNITTEYLFTNT